MNKRGKRLKSNNILPEYGLGSWIKDTAKKGLDLGMDAGLVMADRTLGTFGATNVIDDSMYNTKLGRGLNKVGDVINPLVGQAMATALGGPMAGMAMNAGQQGISSATGSSPEQLAQEELKKEQDKALKYNQTVNSFNSQYNQSPTNIPTFRNGGIINYNGQSHDGPDGGIPIDDNGNPSIQSGNQPTGLTEDKEVAWKLPDGNTFIFSDSLGYAPIAKKIYSKYSKRLGKKMEKTDAISMKGLTQEFNDLAAEQEISKKMDGQKTGVKGTYRYGGTIDGEDGEESTKSTVSHYFSPCVARYARKRAMRALLYDTTDSAYSCAVCAANSDSSAFASSSAAISSGVARRRMRGSSRCIVLVFILPPCRLVSNLRAPRAGSRLACASCTCTRGAGPHGRRTPSTRCRPARGLGARHPPQRRRRGGAPSTATGWLP